MRKDREPIVDEAIKKAGGAALLARHLGITPEALHSWRRIPAERVQKVAEVSGIAPHELRPDIFPVPSA